MIKEEEIDCHLKVEGRNFSEEGTSLHELLKVYSSIEGLFDITYSNALGIERFNRDTRNEYEIIIKEAKIGSWESSFKIFIAISPALFGGGLTPKDYLETIFVTYEFLKTVFTAKKENNPITITSNGTGNQISVETVSGDQYNFYAPININIIQNAQESLPDIKNLMELVKTGSIQNLNLNSQKAKGSVNLSSKDANLFDSEEIKSTEIKEISAELYRFNKRSRTGKLHIHENQSIPAGKYTFSVKKKEIQNEIITSMLKNDTTIVVTEVFIDDPITGTKILNSLEIIDI